jgi:hypothetical protein
MYQLITLLHHKPLYICYIYSHYAFNINILLLDLLQFCGAEKKLTGVELYSLQPNLRHVCSIIIS